MENVFQLFHCSNAILESNNVPLLYSNNRRKHDTAPASRDGFSFLQNRRGERQIEELRMILGNAAP